MVTAKNLPPVIPVWKEVGQSTHKIATQMSEHFKIKVSHTGTLDPMAEGVVIILTGENRHKKYDYAHWLKEYVFEVLFGISTDTYDGLGIIDSQKEPYFSIEQLENAIKSFEGQYVQQVPPFSAIKVKGKPMHWHALNKNLQNIDIPSRSGDIKEIQLLEFKEEFFEQVRTSLIEKINKVEGDLRQEKVLNQWKNFEPSQKTFSIAKIKAVTTKGLYVRTLAVDIAKKLNSGAFVVDLVRTKNGRYNKENSLKISEILANK